MTDAEFNDLVERLREFFQPKPELANKLPDISEVADMTEVVYTENGKKIIQKAVNGEWIKIYEEA